MLPEFIHLFSPLLHIESFKVQINQKDYHSKYFNISSRIYTIDVTSEIIKNINVGKD